MGRLISEYKTLFKNRNYQISLIIGIFILILAGITTLWAINYADKVSGCSLGDLLLDNLPQLNLFWFRTFGIALIVLSIFSLGIFNPRKLPILAKTIGLMYIIRAFFISLTHLKAYAGKIPIPSAYLLGKLPSQGNDLFFSGHVALPFMVALVFWKEKKIRKFFLANSIISGIASILAKTHYSIDIFAAPFIVYGIFKISEKIFRKDFQAINSK